MSYEDGMPSGGNSRFRGYPARMSERQQLALLLQMTSQEAPPGNLNGPGLWGNFFATGQCNSGTGKSPGAKICW